MRHSDSPIASRAAELTWSTPAVAPWSMLRASPGAGTTNERVEPAVAAIARHDAGAVQRRAGSLPEMAMVPPWYAAPIATSFVRAFNCRPKLFQSSCPVSGIIFATRTMIPRSFASASQGAIFAWCSSSVTRTSSPRS